LWRIEVTNASGEIIDTEGARGDSVSYAITPLLLGEEVTIKWIAQDGCNNQSISTTIVSARDTKNPTPLCIQELSTTKMSADGSVTIWAVDFDLGSFDNCGEVAVGFKDDLGDFVPSRTFTCADLPGGISQIIELPLYVLDGSGNEDFCLVNLRIDDHNDACPDNNSGSSVIAGEIRTEDGDMIAATDVTLSSGKAMKTEDDGLYAFNTNPMEASYSIDPSNLSDPLNGVSTLDLIFLQRHILGTQLLDSPYKVIAGDINADKQISSTDLVALRRVLLGLDATFVNNTSWKFVDEKQQFDNALSPWPINEQILIKNLIDNRLEEDFIGIKIGDVSGNAVANGLSSSSRSANKMKYVARDILLQKGSTYNVVFKSEKALNLIGLQSTFDLNGVELLAVTAGDITEESRSWAIGSLQENLGTAIWTRSPDQEEFYKDIHVRLRATKTIKLSDGLKLSNSVVAPVVYDNRDDEYELTIQYEEVNEEVRLYQNEPNPFNQYTSIAFEISNSTTVELSIVNVHGKEIFRHAGDYTAGRHAITVNKNQLGGYSGMVYYQIETGDKILTKKMIVLE